MEEEEESIMTLCCLDEKNHLLLIRDRIERICRIERDLLQFGLLGEIKERFSGVLSVCGRTMVILFEI